MHLLRGVDFNTIRDWLGHVSLNTTDVYAELDLEMKAKALAACEVLRGSTTKALEERHYVSPVSTKPLSQASGCSSAT
jgi:hypothetical protein